MFIFGGRSAYIYIFSRFESKASFPILTTFGGTEIVFNLRHIVKTLFPNFISEKGKCMSVKFRLYAKAQFPIFKMPSSTL